MKLLTSTGWKSLNEEVEKVDESKRDMMVRKFMSHDPEAGESILAMGKKERGEKKAFDSGKKEIKRLKTRNEESEIDYEAFLEHVVMNYPELVEEFLSKQDNKSE